MICISIHIFAAESLNDLVCLYDFHICWQACEPLRPTLLAAWHQLRPMPQGGISPRSPAPRWSCQGGRPPSTPRPTEPTLSPTPTTTSNQTKPQSNSSVAPLSSSSHRLLDFEQKPSRWIVAWNLLSVLSPAFFCLHPLCPPLPHHAPCHQPCPTQPLTVCSTPSTHPTNCPPTPDPRALQPASKAGHGNLLSYRLYVT